VKKPNVKLAYLKSMQYKDEDANTTREEEDGSSNNPNCNQKNYREKWEDEQHKESIFPMNFSINYH
jgi:hypothetical protein